MSQTIIHMRGDGTGGTQDAVANIDVPDDGTIEGVEWAGAASLDANGEEFAAELSFIATNQFGTNDSRGQISTIRAGIGILTSGGGVTQLSRFTPMNLDVAGGERLYLHLTASAGVASSIEINLHFRPSRGLPRRSQRRR